ncbi:GNAT family N-acetyltransferase [Melittangium boletus]|uniref:GNAT family N-acetyltransferase n=1 Tax=Melittangium boletus DSM 14713 TaxID=1294270 RepID=A0A250IA29_9BACT|nr:GNAT family N-acetyltransferase [Melittangium boletus]ATB28615.1 GNAT family N-acetyltransferase [Melittangium boletus DSM 14713]
MNHDSGTSSWAEVATFVQAHPAPGMSLDDARRIVTSLVRGPEAVLDLEDERGRWVVAAVVDTCASVDHSADLVPLGLREREVTPQALHHLLDRAEACVLQGPLSTLDITLTPERESWEEPLRARGYAPAYSLYALERPAEGPPLAPRAPLPQGWRWMELEEDQLPDYHRVVSAAFASVPGAFVPPLEEMAQAVSRAERRPHVLVEDRKVHAFTTVRVHAREDGLAGEVRTLGREPGLRGTGLGEHALGRALELLRAERVTRFELEAAARNDAALRLYQRHGFQIVRSVPLFRRRLTERR